MSHARADCPVCGGTSLVRGVRIENVPAHVVTLHATRDKAQAEPRGTVDLQQCQGCAFVFNATYDPSLHHYDQSYESTQSHSATFRDYSLDLASRIVARCGSVSGPFSGPIVEVGCGQGEFLTDLLVSGATEVIGFDPAFDRSRAGLPDALAQAIFPTVFTPEALTQTPSAFVNKMTLEHVGDPVAMMAGMARAAGAKTQVCIQVPNCTHIFDNVMFWDVLYEHTNYFVPQTLAFAMAQSGLSAEQPDVAYEGQHLHGYGQVSGGVFASDMGYVAHEIKRFENFCTSVEAEVAALKVRFQTLAENGGKLGFWGAGSKVAALLSFTGCDDLFECAIDINPIKQGTFLPGSGLEIVSPQEAATRGLTDLFLANPIYRCEIQKTAHRFGIMAALHDLRAV